MKDRYRRSETVRRKTGCIKRAAFIGLAGILLLSACGKKQQEQSGTQGQPETRQQSDQEGEYLYVPEGVEGILPELDLLGQRHFVVNGDYLYYLTDGIYRIPLGEKLDLTRKETVAQRDSLLESEMENIEYFTVDQDQNLYYISYSYRDGTITLHKRTAEGEEVYSSPMEEMTTFSSNSILAADGTGGVYVLRPSSIQHYGPEGSLMGELPLEEEMAERSGASNYLIGLPDGHVFFITCSAPVADSRAYEIPEGDRPRLQEVESLSQAVSRGQAYPGLDGLLIQFSDGVLYRYSLADGSVETVLSWQDCDFYRHDIGVVLQVSEGQLLVVANIGESMEELQEMFLLTKTPADQVPRKETITLASLFPSDDMEKAAAKFNRRNSRYHVTIESYGAGSFYSDANEGARARLDSALISKENAPDLLDLSNLDVIKYVEAGALEDLYPYMEQGGQIHRENFLSNLLEGYTFDGKLACIPKTFIFKGAYITDERILETAEWTMESVLETAGQYPDARLFPEDEGGLQEYYGAYLLEKFVDWESGECRFDSEEFSRLLERVKQESALAGLEPLLDVQSIMSFDEYQKVLMEAAESKEKAVLRGLPSADGTDTYTPRAWDVLGISVNSRQKDGAWEFMQFYLQEGMQVGFSYRFPTLLSLLDQVQAYSVTPQYEIYDGKVLTDSDGRPRERPRYTQTRNGVKTEFYALGQEEAETLRSALEQIDFRPRGTLEQSVLSIVEEEAAVFIKGEKTVDETTEVIQNRVSLLLQENL